MEWDEELESAGFEYIAEGSFRRVFGRGKIVIKVPLNRDGEIDNIMEAKAWHHFKSRPTSLGVYLAPCRLVSNGYLIMVLVETLDDCDSQLPKWADMVDNCQAGLYKGRIVAYDYALNLKERFKWEREMNLESEFFHCNEWQNKRPYLHSESEEPF